MFCGENMEGSLRGRDVRKLNTQGCCFLCLEPNTINLEVNGEVDETEPKLIRKEMSMRCLTRYLKHNLDGMEQATSSAGMSKAAFKPEMDVQVDLCESCLKLASRFSSLFRQLEKVRMELEYYFGEIHRTVSYSSMVPELVGNYSRAMTSDRKSLSQLVLVDKLRYEIREKGLRTRRAPTVTLKRIERLPKQEVPDPVEEMEHTDDFADFDDTAWSSIENFVAEEPDYDPEQRLPEIKKEPEDSSATPEKDVKLFTKERKHRSKVTSFLKNSLTGQYECTLCKTPFKSVKSVRKHYTAAHLKPHKPLKKEFKCASCNKSFSTLANLKRHQGICEKTRGRQGRSEFHFRNPETGQYHCRKCPAVYKGPSNVRAHYYSVHLKRKYNCDMCSSVFSHCESLSGHRKICRGRAEVKLSQGEKKNREEFQFICEICGKRYETERYLKKHKAKCTGKGDKGILSRSEFYTQNAETGLFHCKKCPAKYTHAASAYTHYTSVHLQKKYKCAICNSVFSHSTTFYTHKKICREGKLSEEEERRKDFQCVCDTCGKRFETDKHLIDHRSRVHFNPKSYPCDLCDKVFKQGDCMRIHRDVVHFGKTFDCRFCKVKYRTRNNLRRHERKCSHKPTEENN